MKALLIKFSFMLICTLMLSGVSYSQDKTGEVVFLRPVAATGYAVNFRVYVDGKLICKVANKRFSSHQLILGTHTVTVESGGIEVGKKDTPLQIEVKEGEIKYIQLAQSKGMHGKELTQASGEFIKKKLKPVKDCLAETE